MIPPILEVVRIARTTVNVGSRFELFPSRFQHLEGIRHLKHLALCLPQPALEAAQVIIQAGKLVLQSRIRLLATVDELSQGRVSCAAGLRNFYHLPHQISMLATETLRKFTELSTFFLIVLKFRSCLCCRPMEFSYVSFHVLGFDLEGLQHCVGFAKVCSHLGQVTLCHLVFGEEPFFFTPCLDQVCLQPVNMRISVSQACAECLQVLLLLVQVQFVLVNPRVFRGQLLH
mmetsp:Transcript_60370/g.116435  ORF Transcript_60370/g.116435 Transcript_60370/m.116435 type:complete len:230 (-) Transcript_60370:266-955(-)